MKVHISPDYEHAAEARYNADKAESEKTGVPMTDTLDHYRDNEIDGFVRNMMFPSNDPNVLHDHMYDTKENLEKYSPSMMPYMKEIRMYLMGQNEPVPEKKEGGTMNLDDKEKDVLTKLLMEKAL